MYYVTKCLLYYIFSYFVRSKFFYYYFCTNHLLFNLLIILLFYFLFYRLFIIANSKHSKVSEQTGGSIPPLLTYIIG